MGYLDKNMTPKQEEKLNKQIIAWRTKGWTYPQIGKELGMSPEGARRRCVILMGDKATLFNKGKAKINVTKIAGTTRAKAAKKITKPIAKTKATKVAANKKPAVKKLGTTSGTGKSNWGGKRATKLAPRPAKTKVATTGSKRPANWKGLRKPMADIEPTNVTE